MTERYFNTEGPKQYIVLELKIKRQSKEKTIEDGLIQTAEYMDRCARPGLREGHLVMFNMDQTVTIDGIRRDISWDDKIFHEERDFGDYHIHIWGM